MNFPDETMYFYIPSGIFGLFPDETAFFLLLSGNHQGISGREADEGIAIDIAN